MDPFTDNVWTPLSPNESQARRPSSLDLGGWTTRAPSTASSGYCSAENSTESEYPPFDFDSVRQRLEQLEESPSIILEATQELGVISKDFTFNILVQPYRNSVPAFDAYKRKLNVVVLGPRRAMYPVKTTPGRKLSQITCSFVPKEVGTFTAFVDVEDSRMPKPKPLQFRIEKDYFEPDMKIYMTTDVTAGTPSAGTGKVDRKMWGICCNTRTNEVIVPDREQHEILVYGPDGSLKGKVGRSGPKSGSGPGQFFRPVAVAYNEVLDRIYVSDKDNHRIQIFTGQGKFLKSFGRKGKYPGQLCFPWGIAVSRDGSFVAVADSRNHRIQIFDKDGFLVKVFNGDSEYQYPRGVCFNEDGTLLYLTDFKLHRVYELDLYSGAYQLLFWNLNRPSGISVDPAGNIIVCDTRRSSLRIIPKNARHGQGVREIKFTGRRQIESPLDVICMPNGFVGLLDRNGRITIF